MNLSSAIAASVVHMELFTGRKTLKKIIYGYLSDVVEVILVLK